MYDGVLENHLLLDPSHPCLLHHFYIHHLLHLLPIPHHYRNHNLRYQYL